MQQINQHIMHEFKFPMALSRACGFVQYILISPSVIEPACNFKLPSTTLVESAIFKDNEKASQIRSELKTRNMMRIKY